ncbi:MAG: class III extradiol ring-cleavage dioxygenase [Thermoplasmata archaeon]
MPLVYAAYLPNAPVRIDPDAFGGVGAETVAAIRGLRVDERFAPGAVLVSSPHWVTAPGFRANASRRPRQIYDVSGFPPRLSEVKDSPPGDPALARALVTSGRASGIEVEATEAGGLDHGAWAPLRHLRPEGSTPTVPLSITPDPPETHLRWGRAIGAALASWPVPVAPVATGSIAHNFDRFDPRPGARRPEGERFEQEILGLLRARDDAALLSFDRRKWQALQPEGGPAALFALLGAVGPEVRPRTIESSSVLGGFGMSIVEFVPDSGSGPRPRLRPDGAHGAP